MVLLFAVVYIFSNNEHIREEIGDKGFDLMDKFVLSKERVHLTNAPSLLLFSYDNLYMKSKNLWDEDNNSNYGNLFERSRLTEFIEVLDNRSTRLKKFGKATPKALFVDFDLSFTLMPNGHTLSEPDRAFLERLKVKRDYVIVLPKTQSANFVEKSEDKQIQALIAQKKIVFASVGFNLSKDNTVRRYRAFEKFHENGVEKLYPNVNVVLWRLSQNQERKESLKNRDVVSNRILFKANEEGLATQSKWENYKHYSVLRHESKKSDRIALMEYANAIVMLGTSYTNNADTFQVLNIFGSEEQSGVEIHANTLMSLFFFDGQLKLLSFKKSMLMVFLWVFVVDALLSTFLLLLGLKSSTWTNILSITLSVVVMFLFSLALLNRAYWFDWFAPTVLFDIMI